MAGYYDEITGEYIDTGDTGVNTGPLDNTSGTADMSKWTYSNGVWTDPSGTPFDLRYLPSVSGAKSPWDVVTSLFKGTSSLGSAGQLAGIAGLAGILNSMFGSSGGSQYAGYSGGIPQLTATRTMNPIPTTVPAPTAENPAAVAPRRPGSGGITYFTPMVYTPKTTTTAASGGIMSVPGYNLGGYSDGGRLLRGPGDGVSDDIPATIGNRQPARLADGEFVVSADVVSGLGNGSTEAGARKLYAMMDRVRKARTGTKQMGKTVNPDKLIPS